MTDRLLSENSGWIDSHCHLDDLEDSQSQTQHAIQLGISYFIIPSTEQKQWPKLNPFQGPNFYKAFGTHPWFVKSPHQEAKALLEKIVTTPVVESQLKSVPSFISNSTVAIGEIGLDFFNGQTPRPPRSIQIESFELQLDVATQVNLPVILHCVKAQSEILSVCKNMNTTDGVVHGFNGSLESAVAFVDQGFHLGMGPMILKSPKTLNAFSHIPVERIILETDSPFMKTNLNSNSLEDLIHIAQFYCEMNNLDIDDFKTTMFKNTQRLFKLLDKE